MSDTTIVSAQKLLRGGIDELRRTSVRQHGNEEASRCKGAPAPKAHVTQAIRNAIALCRPYEREVLHLRERDS